MVEITNKCMVEITNKCMVKNTNKYTCMVESKPVEEEVSCTLILPLKTKWVFSYKTFNLLSWKYNWQKKLLIKYFIKFRLIWSHNFQFICLVRIDLSGHTYRRKTHFNCDTDSWNVLLPKIMYFWAVWVLVFGYLGTAQNIQFDESLHE